MSCEPGLSPSWGTQRQLSLSGWGGGGAQTLQPPSGLWHHDPSTHWFRLCGPQAPRSSREPGTEAPQQTPSGARGRLQSSGFFWKGVNIGGLGVEEKTKRGLSAPLPRAGIPFSPDPTPRGILRGGLPTLTGLKARNPGSFEYPRNVGATGGTLYTRLLIHPNAPPDACPHRRRGTRGLGEMWLWFWG